jgi:hypothetical protein
VGACTAPVDAAAAQRARADARRFRKRPAGSTRAVGWAVPCLLGVFSLVVLVTYAPHPRDLLTRRAAWYSKPEVTLIDPLAAVRQHPLGPGESARPRPWPAAGQFS